MMKVSFFINNLIIYINIPCYLPAKYLKIFPSPILSLLLNQLKSVGCRIVSKFWIHGDQISGSIHCKEYTFGYVKISYNHFRIFPIWCFCVIVGILYFILHESYAMKGSERKILNIWKSYFFKFCWRKHHLFIKKWQDFE